MRPGEAGHIGFLLAAPTVRSARCWVPLRRAGHGQRTGLGPARPRPLASGQPVRRRGWRPDRRGRSGPGTGPPPL